MKKNDTNKVITDRTADITFMVGCYALYTLINKYATDKTIIENYTRDDLLREADSKIRKLFPKGAKLTRDIYPHLFDKMDDVETITAVKVMKKLMVEK